MKRALWAFVLLPSISPPPVLAQEPMAVEPGQRVRVTAPECQLRKQKGTLLSISDGMFVAAEGRKGIVCPLAALTRLDVSVGERKPWKASVLGMGIGAVGGLAVGMTVTEGETSEIEGLVVLFATATGAAGGFLIGTIVGFARGTDNWKPVPLPVVQPTLTLAPDGRFGFGFSLSLRR